MAVISKNSVSLWSSQEIVTLLSAMQLSTAPKKFITLPHTIFWNSLDEYSVKVVSYYPSKTAICKKKWTEVLSIVIISIDTVDLRLNILLISEYEVPFSIKFCKYREYLCMCRTMELFLLNCLMGSYGAKAWRHVLFSFEGNNVSCL